MSATCQQNANPIANETNKVMKFLRTFATRVPVADWIFEASEASRLVRTPTGLSGSSKYDISFDKVRIAIRVQPDSAHHPRTRCYHYLLDQHILTTTCASVASLTSCLLMKYNSRCVKYKVIYLIVDELFSNG